MQAIRGWWLWAHYVNPLAWTTYGLVASQLGDVQSLVVQHDGSQITVVDYISTYLGFQHNFIGWCMLILVGFSVFFRVVSTVALQHCRFQSR